MKYSGIGGQAVMEGVMMRNGDRYAVAVRKTDGEIELKEEEYTIATKTKILRNIPILRGVFSFVDSLYLGMSTLMYSASFFDEEEPKEEDLEQRSKKEREELERKKKKEESILLGGTVVFSIVFAIALFFALPYLLSSMLHLIGLPNLLILFLEGVLRLLIFVLYIALISINKDIKRVFMYHGAEHKCINCIEQGLALNVENVRKSSKEHKRCGTSFLLLVMIISMVFFMFIQVEMKWLQIVLRLLFIPVIAGVSYEFLRLAGRYENAFLNLMSKPGLWMQGLTTKEPDDEMIEVGIASVEAVFDWKEWQKENRMEKV